MIKQLKLKIKPSEPAPVDLGKKLAFFPLRKNGLKQRISLGTSILLMAAFIILIVYRLITTSANVQTYGRAIITRQSSGSPVGYLVLIGLAVLMFFLSRYFTKIGVHIYQNGIEIDDYYKKRTIVWEDIIEFDSRIVNSKFGDSIIGTNVKLKMMDKEGHRITIKNEFDRMDRFLEEIRQGILPVLYKNAFSRLAHGKRLAFNSEICAIKTGIEIKGQFFFWKDLIKADVKFGNLEIITSQNRNEPFKFPVEQVTNLDVLVFIIQNPPIRHYSPER